LIDIVIQHNPSLINSEEFAFGYRELQTQLPYCWRTYNINADTYQSIIDIVGISSADYLLVILNPALIVSDNLAHGLDFATTTATDKIDCLLANDQRATGGDCIPDYATKAGFDRFVKLLATQPVLGPYDGRDPWIYMVKRSTVESLSTEQADIKWAQIPAMLGDKTAVARHVYVHSYADYYLNDRAEMLDILPASVHSLLDIGGGEGNFIATYLAYRGGRATLLEQNQESVQKARLKGLDVIEGDFLSVEVTEPYACVSMLDVLEHTIDPLQVLEKIRTILQLKGYLLLSVPNAGHWSVVSDLLEGRFDYQPVGILCNTHLRFFTRRSLQQLLVKAGFEIEKWKAVHSPPPADFSQFVSTAPAWLTADMENLSTDCFHILASRR